MKTLKKNLKKSPADKFPRSTLGEERAYNPFMRTDDPAIVNALEEKYFLQENDPMSVFIKLRELRDKW